MARETWERGASGAGGEGCLEEGRGRGRLACWRSCPGLGQSAGAVEAMLDDGEVAGWTGSGGPQGKELGFAPMHEAIGV